VPAPPALTSATFTADFNLTKSYGALDSSVRTAQQTEIGLFWSDNPAAQYSRALRGLIGTQGLGTADAARLGALSFVALADSATACMNAKYHFLFWRPLTAIRNAGTDGNPGTVADPNWVPLDVTPGHPEYPANHGCVTQALMDAMTAFFATDAVPYSITSTVTGTTHSFASFEDVVQEVDEARIFGGMHFHHSVKEGNKLGRRVADYILDHKFCRVNEGCGTEDQWRERGRASGVAAPKAAAPFVERGSARSLAGSILPRRRNGPRRFAKKQEQVRPWDWIGVILYRGAVRELWAREVRHDRSLRQVV